MLESHLTLQEWRLPIRAHQSGAFLSFLSHDRFSRKRGHRNEAIAQVSEIERHVLLLCVLCLQLLQL